MEGKNRVKLLVSVLAIVIAFAVFIKPLASTVKQGLDLQGGTHVVLQAQETPESKVDDDAINRSIQIIERRVNELGLTEPVIQRQGKDKIIVELPGVKDPEQAIAMLATGVYMNSGVKGGGLSMGSALNSVIQSQINSLAGSAFQSINASFTMGMEDRTSAETGDKQTDYSFRYSQRLFNDRVQIVIGGKVTTGANATNDAESFIDNISLEYRLDTSGTRYVRVFYDKNYESVLDGEITETGVGLVLRRKMDRLGELFIFRKKKKQTVE